MDKNLLGITTLNQSHSMTPLMTSGKGQLMGSTYGNNLNMNSDQYGANNLSNSRLEGMSTMDFNNSKRSPFQSSKKHNLDESNDNLSQLASNYDQNTMFNSPGLNKSYDKTSGSKVQLHGIANVKVASVSNSQQLGAAQRLQPSNVLAQSFGSPDKSNVKNDARRGSQARSGKSNSSRDSSGHDHRHGSARRGLNKSATRRSYSTDQDSTERSFTYPCQAFKQFLLAVREGKIDMKDLNNSPFLMDYLSMQASTGAGGGGTGSGGDGKNNFQNSLRSSNASNRSGSKGRDHSKSNQKVRKSSNIGGGEGSLLKNPRDSIIEEEEDDNMPANSSNNQVKNRNSSAINNAKKQVIPSPQKIQSTLQTQKQPSSGQSTDSKGNSLAKHNFKEDQSKQLQQPVEEGKRQRRGRLDRSTSGDERASVGGGGNNSSIKKATNNRGDSSGADVRFDEKGRPIKNNTYSSAAKPKHNLNQKSNDKNGGVAGTSDDDQNTQGDYASGANNNNNNSLNNSFNNGKTGKKDRRGRRDRDSSVSSSADIHPSNLHQSPNEPRSISKLPKPTSRDDQIRQSTQIQNAPRLPQIDEKVNNNGDGYGEDGTFRDYQNPSTRRDDGDDTGRLPIFDKNTDFKTDADYSLNALKDNQTKKYLKSKASPLKKQQFREDDEDSINNSNIINLNEDEDEVINNNNNNDTNQSNIGVSADDQSHKNNPLLDEQLSERYQGNQTYTNQDPTASAVGITMIQKKTPSRESRKVQSSLNNTNLNNDRSRSNLSNQHIQGGNSVNSLQDADFQGTQPLNSLNPNDRAMQRQDLDSHNEDDVDLIEDHKNQSSADKKQRRGRASRGGNQSSEVSQDRQPVSQHRMFDSASRNNQSQLDQSHSMNISQKSPSKIIDQQLTIEEHLDTYRSKTSSQIIVKSQRSFYRDEDDSNNGNNSHRKSNYANDKSNKKSQSTMKHQQQQQQDRSSKSYKEQQNNNNDDDGDDSEHFEEYDDPNFDQEINDRQFSKDLSTKNNSPMKNQDRSNRNYQKSQGGSPLKGRDESGDKSQKNILGNSGIKLYERSNKNSKNNSSAKNRTQQYKHEDDEDNDQDFNSNNQLDTRIDSPSKQESSRYKDDYYNNNQNSSRLERTQERKRQNRKNSGDNNDTSQIRESQRSLSNLGNANNDEYNYSSFGQQQQQEHQDNNKNNNFGNEEQKNSNSQNNNNNSSGKKQRRKRGSREKSYDSGSEQNNNKDNNGRSSQIKSSLQPLRASRVSNNNKNTNYGTNNQQYQTNDSSNLGDNHDQKSLQKYQSRLKQLEDKLKYQVQQNPTKPLDYKLIQEINDEAARTIQLNYRLKKQQKKHKEEAPRKHGNLVDRKVQTEPINLFSLAMKQPNGMNDMDKFKKFFFAVFYTYMMMNTIMGDVFKRQQPIQTQNQWNQQDYQNYLNTRQNRQNNKKE